MLADVVALMLTFFVLGFSMRVMVPAPGAPLIAVDDASAALAVLERWSTESLTAAERPSGPMPPFPYLAALLGRLSIATAQASTWHDESRLMVTFDGDPAVVAETGSRSARDLLLAMAFLARRFDLDLSLTMPGPSGVSLATQVSRALRLQAWLSAETRHAAPEVIFAPTAADGGTGEFVPDRWRAEIRRRPALAAAAGLQ